MNLTPDDLRIRQALEQIETPMYDIAGAVREQRARRGRRMPLRSPQRILAAILAAILLTATAAAAVAQLSGGWHALFGQGTLLPDGLTTPVWQSQTINGCTVTLEDAIVTEGDVAVLYSFRCENAEALHSDAYMTMLGSSELLIDGSDEFCMGSSGIGSLDAQDPTVEYYYDAFTLTEDPGERQLTLHIGAASRTETTEALSASVDLDAVYRSHPVHHAEADDGTQRLTALRQQNCTGVILPQASQSPEIRFAGVAFEGDILCVALKMPAYNTYDGEAAQIESLRDNRTGRLYFGAQSTYSDTDGTTELCETRFEGLTEADLPYLEPQISYRRSTPLTDKGWSFTFSAPSARTLTRELQLNMADGIRIDRLKVSPLGLELSGTMPVNPSQDNRLFFDDKYAPTVVLVLQDGSTVQTAVRGHSLSSNGEQATSAEFGIEYEFQAGAGSRRFLKTETIAAIRIGHVTIPIAE